MFYFFGDLKIPIFDVKWLFFLNRCYYQFSGSMIFIFLLFIWILIWWFWVDVTTKAQRIWLTRISQFSLEPRNWTEIKRHDTVAQMAERVTWDWKVLGSIPPDLMRRLLIIVLSPEMGIYLSLSKSTKSIISVVYLNSNVRLNNIKICMALADVGFGCRFHVLLQP